MCLVQVFDLYQITSLSHCFSLLFGCDDEHEFLDLNIFYFAGKKWIVWNIKSTSQTKKISPCFEMCFSPAMFIVSLFITLSIQWHQLITIIDAQFHSQTRTLLCFSIEIGHNQGALFEFLRVDSIDWNPLFEYGLQNFSISCCFQWIFMFLWVFLKEIGIKIIV